MILTIPLATGCEPIWGVEVTWPSLIGYNLRDLYPKYPRKMLIQDQVSEVENASYELL